MQLVLRQPNEAAPARIAALSVLPVFLDLAGKRAVVAGGGDAAAWKAELLAAAGAQVHVHAPQDGLRTDMCNLLETRPGIVHHPHTWSEASLAGAAVAVADAPDDAEAAAFHNAARRAGVPCNIIDQPAFCDFQFGSIVNRSPVVIGISTSGAAPILGQAIRRRIETLLPPALAEWAAMAGRLRDRVAECLPSGAQRRAFWERVAARAFGPAPDAASEAALHGAMGTSARVGEAGHVTFVGAGPGDAELLTLKAVRALQSADVILFDDLVSDEVLELARREAKRILVGKRAGRPSCKQHEINAMMLDLVKTGRRVVRLKSGDPMIFGRAGEEIAMLEDNGIAYDVVPGITAGLAMAARLGVSLTHRDCARSVRFLTGHSQHGGLPADVDWNAVADPTTTTIFYMGGRMAGLISTALIDHGMPAHTPAVVGANIGRPGETIRGTDLAGLKACCALTGDGQPVLIGVGSVFMQKSRSLDSMDSATIETPSGRQAARVPQSAGIRC